MPNPFDLRGPAFLLFYSVLGVLVALTVAVLRRRAEPAVRTTAPLTDYLKIAYLRGGPSEALRVATFALLDRGLVEIVDQHRVKRTAERMPAGLPRTEQRVLESCRDATRASAIVDDTSLRVTVTAECEAPLVRAGLLPDANSKAVQQGLLIGGVLVLGLVALVKIALALGRGRPNVGFLVVAAVAFGYLVYRVATPVRTLAGDAMLADLRQLFSAARQRATTPDPRGGTNELALIAAVFGLGGVGERLFRNPAHHASDGGTCGSGGSCGSGCGGSCGGGCGGCGS
jgi:uncharacterized protein (TIGR04222 family)